VHTISQKWYLQCNFYSRGICVFFLLINDRFHSRNHRYNTLLFIRPTEILDFRDTATHPHYGHSIKTPPSSPNFFLYLQIRLGHDSLSWRSFVNFQLSFFTWSTKNKFLIYIIENKKMNFGFEDKKVYSSNSMNCSVDLLSIFKKQWVFSFQWYNSAFSFYISCFFSEIRCHET